MFAQCSVLLKDARRTELFAGIQRFLHAISLPTGPRPRGNGWLVLGCNRTEPPTMANSRESLLQEFVDWTKEHIRGDEKGEAQIFFDHLFRAFGQKGSLDVGGTPELRIPKSQRRRRRHRLCQECLLPR